MCTRDVHEPIGKWRDSARFFVHASVYGAPTRGEARQPKIRGFIEVYGVYAVKK